MDLGIVIVNYDTRDLLDQCLRSVREALGAIATRVVVVDNHSGDGSGAMVRREHPWVFRLIESGANEGYACANNAGLRALGLGQSAEEAPRYVLLLNPDTVVPPDALTEALAFMESNPAVGALGPRLVREDGSLDRACRRSFPTPEVSLYRFSGLSRLFPRSRRFGRYNLTYLDADAQADVDALVGAFMLIRGMALQQVGLLDESFFMYGEDLDLCYRIKQAGWRVVYYPAITVLHIKGAASRKASRRALIAFYDAMRIFHNKHYRAHTCFVVNWSIDLAVALLRWVALARDSLRPAGRKRVASA